MPAFLGRLVKRLFSIEGNLREVPDWKPPAEEDVEDRSDFSESVDVQSSPQPPQLDEIEEEEKELDEMERSHIVADRASLHDEPLPSTDSLPAPAGDLENEIEEVLPPDTSEQGRLLAAELSRRIATLDFEIPHFSSAATEIMKLHEQGDVKLEEVVDLLECDPELAEKIIRAADAPLYRSIQGATSVRDAVIEIGARELPGVVCMVSLRSGDFCVEGAKEISDRISLHSVGCALVSRLLAKPFGSSPEEVMLAGGLHDVGKLVALNAIQDIRAEITPDYSPFPDLISAILVQFHARLGELAVNEWGLSSSLAAAVRHHHQPLAAGEAQPLASAVYLGDRVCHHEGIGVDPRPTDLEEIRRALKVKITEERFDAIARKARKTFDENQEYLVKSS